MEKIFKGTRLIVLTRRDFEDNRLFPNLFDDLLEQLELSTSDVDTLYLWVSKAEAE
jgi:hypothetical protein